MNPEYCEIERKAYAEGFRAAREKAAGIAEKYRVDIEVVNVASRIISDRIRKMEVTT